MIDFRGVSDLLWSKESDPFPESLCVTQNDQEPDVFDADVWFLCACINKRFPHSLELRQLKPYTAKSIDTGEVLYGWVDQFGNYIDHCERPIHLDDEVVVRWIRLKSQFSWLEILEGELREE